MAHRGKLHYKFGIICILLSFMLLAGCGKQENYLSEHEADVISDILNAVNGTEEKTPDYYNPLPEEEWEYSLNCVIETDEYIAEYDDVITDEETIQYYKDFIEQATLREEIADPNYAVIDDDWFRIKQNRYKFVNYALVQIEDIREDNHGDEEQTNRPALMVIDGYRKFYELNWEEYENYKQHVINDCEKLGINCNTTYKCRNDSYYEITDAYPKDSIMILDYYQNYAEGFQCTGYFIDEHGYLYNFDLSRHAFNLELREMQENGYPDYTSNDLFFDALYYEVYYKKSPSKQIDEEYMNELLDTMCMVNTDASWTEEFAAYDAGQSSLSIVIDYKERRLTTSGDYDGYLDDENAKAFVELMEKLEAHCTEIK